jgi:hypothetical protein
MKLISHTPGLGLHKTRTISFTLVVGDFAVKYVGKGNVHHLHNAFMKSQQIGKAQFTQL